MHNDKPELLKSHFEDPYHRGECERPTCGSQSHDSATGHFIAVQLRIDRDKIIEEAWFDGVGCWQCEAPASILVQFCEGRSIEELGRLDSSFFLALTQLDRLEFSSSCQLLAWTALRDALCTASQSAELGIDYDSADSSRAFGGPSLGEEA